MAAFAGSQPALRGRYRGKGILPIIGSRLFPIKLASPLELAEMTAVSAAERRRRLCLRTVLIIVALVELVAALLDLPDLFRGVHDLFREASGSGFAEAITTAHLICHPLLALAAVVFAATGRVRHAIIALGIVVIMTWLNHLPWLGRLDLGKARDVQWAAKQIIAFPLMAAFAIALAVRDARLGLATALVSIPTISNLASLTAYAIGLIVNGF